MQNNKSTRVLETLQSDYWEYLEARKVWRLAGGIVPFINPIAEQSITIDTDVDSLQILELTVEDGKFEQHEAICVGTKPLVMKEMSGTDFVNDADYAIFMDAASVEENFKGKFPIKGKFYEVHSGHVVHHDNGRCYTRPSVYLYWKSFYWDAGDGFMSYSFQFAYKDQFHHYPESWCPDMTIIVPSELSKWGKTIAKNKNIVIDAPQPFCRILQRHVMTYFNNNHK